MSASYSVHLSTESRTAAETLSKVVAHSIAPLAKTKPSHCQEPVRESLLKYFFTESEECILFKIVHYFFGSLREMSSSECLSAAPPNVCATPQMPSRISQAQSESALMMVDAKRGKPPTLGKHQAIYPDVRPPLRPYAPSQHLFMEMQPNTSHRAFFIKKKFHFFLF